MGTQDRASAGRDHGRRPSPQRRDSARGHRHALFALVLGGWCLPAVTALGQPSLPASQPERGASEPPPAAVAKAEPPVVYALVETAEITSAVRTHFGDAQIRLLEKLNRADADHLLRAGVLVVPSRWDLDELAYSPLPASIVWAAQHPKLLVVDQPAQAFGGYEAGRLVRWGPISSGRRGRPTPAGRYHLTWKSPGRHSSVDPSWYMRWYFNFDNQRGISFHAFALPGYPASHACVRLLERDARWLYGWGDQWGLDAGETAVLRPGTPVVVTGGYDFSAPPLWRSLDRLSHGVAPPEPISRTPRPP